MEEKVLLEEPEPIRNDVLFDKNAFVSFGPTIPTYLF